MNNTIKTDAFRTATTVQSTTAVQSTSGVESTISNSGNAVAPSTATNVAPLRPPSNSREQLLISRNGPGGLLPGDGGGNEGGGDNVLGTPIADVGWLLAAFLPIIYLILKAKASKRKASNKTNHN